jgi:oligosaccharide translocation protein RFT1
MTDTDTPKSDDDEKATTNIDIPESRAAARGTLVTLLLRLVSFACTQATFRLLDPSTLGKANIQLELLLTTVLFISREGFRLALTRNVSPENWNVAWLTIPVVTVVAGSTLIWHLSVATDQDYRIAGSLYCIASWIEGCAEPAVLYFLRNMNVPKRASAEGLATVAKTMATVILLQYIDAQWHVTAFGVAQLIYAITYSSYLYTSSWSKLVGPTKSFDKKTCSMTLVFTVQGFFKHLLTEADRIVLTAVSNSYNQGVYAMGSSYGGMAARILLQPLEENARLLWSRLASRRHTKDLEQSYTTLVKLVLYIGLVFSCVAVNYTNLLLSVLAGRKWGSNTEAATVLSAFCVYTAFLACNGMTEAFVYGVATSGKEIGRLGMAHTVTGVAFAFCASSFVSTYGTVGLVVANYVAMTMRSMYSLHFAARYFGELESRPPMLVLRRLLGEISPHPVVLGCFGLAFAATRWTLGRLQEENFHQALDFRNKEWLLLTSQHLAAGVSSVIGIASIAIALEVGFIRSLKSMVRAKQD